jgi:hypothetical protein
MGFMNASDEQAVREVMLSLAACNALSGLVEATTERRCKFNSLHSRFLDYDAPLMARCTTLDAGPMFCNECGKELGLGRIYFACGHANCDGFDICAQCANVLCAQAS